MEIVTEAISCVLAGSLFAIILSTLPLNLPVKIIMIVGGVALFVIAPILLTLTFNGDWRPKAKKLMLWVNILLFLAAILSLVYTMGKSITTLHDLNLGWLASVYVIYVSACMLLVLAAEIAAIIAIFTNYGWRAWLGKPAISRRKKGERAG
jgi:hypothetical protein